MGLVKEKILLSEDKIRQFKKQFHKDYKLTKPADKRNLDLVFKMALRYVKLAQEHNKYRGRYEKVFPVIAKGICATFGPSDKELAACFETNEYTIENWKLFYPDFKKQISAGQKRFRNTSGNYQQYKKGLYPFLARRICTIFKASDKQLAECFGVDNETFIQWKSEDEGLRMEIHCARNINSQESMEGFEALLYSSNEKNDNAE